MSALPQAKCFCYDGFIVQKLKRFLGKLRGYISWHPKSVIPISFAVFLLVFGSFELIRAYRYLERVDDFRQSPDVVKLRDTAEKLAREVEAGNSAAYCSISIDGLIGETNEAYADESEQRSITHELAG